MVVRFAFNGNERKLRTSILKLNFLCVLCALCG